MSDVKLTTFIPPRPSPRLMRVVDAFNRKLLLSGVPGMRSLPWFKNIPLIAGVAKIRHLDFLEPDLARLRELLAPGGVTFVAANHPEFFTDWVIDRELAARFAPEMATWLPAPLVNGNFQSFWLRNNCIPSLVGPDGNPAKVHSLDWALQGKGVLLHPESSSGWHGDEIAPIYPSIAEMAIRAQLSLERQKISKSANIVPLVWKLRFLQDEDDALHREVDYVEAKLGLRKNKSEKLEWRVYGITEQLLEQEETRCGVLPLYNKTFVQRWEYLYNVCLKRIFGAEVAKYSSANPAIAVRIAHKLSESKIEKPAAHLQAMLWLSRFSPHLYAKDSMTQEQVAEIIKRVRYHHCDGAIADKVNQILPTPAGPRIAYFAVGPTISMAEYRKNNPGKSPDLAKEEITKLLRTRMQTALNELNARVTDHSGYVNYPNPFHLPAVAERHYDEHEDLAIDQEDLAVEER